MSNRSHKSGIYCLIFVFSSCISLSLFAENFPLGGVAPYGNPDQNLNAADLLILQRMVSGEITPTNNEILLGDVAPDNALNAGDLVVLERAILGLESLGTIDIISLPKPTLIEGLSSTNDNPYLISGTASLNANVDIYVNGVLQQQTISDAAGDFSINVFLLDGPNNIYAIENDGVNVSPPSNILQVQYDTVIDKNNVPAIISVDTVWTVGNPLEPYVVTSKLTIAFGVKLVIQPGVSIVFEDDLSTLEVSGELIIMGESDNKVLLTESTQIPGQGWNGIYVDYGGKVTIDHAVIEYANNYTFSGSNSGIYFSSGSGGSVSNTLIRYCYLGIRMDGRTSPIIGPDNIITENDTGIEVLDYARNYVTNRPTPAINANKIFNNTSFNLYSDLSDVAGAPINARGNYWGTTGLSQIIEELLYLEYIDFSGYVDANGYVVSTDNVLQGSITADSPPLLENTTYEVFGMLEIPSGITLTIPKGATLNFSRSSGLIVAGNLTVLGTQSEPVTFASGLVEPSQFDWSGIQIQSGGTANIDFAVIENAYTGIYFYEGSNGTVKNTITRDNDISIKIVGSSPMIGPGNKIMQNGGIVLNKGTINPEPEIKNNQIYSSLSVGNFIGGINTLVDVRGNYWGTVNASEIRQGNCSKSSLSRPCVDYGGYLDVNGNVADAPGISLIGILNSDSIQPNITYEVLGYIEVPAEITLTIPAGTKLIFADRYNGLQVNGALVVAGTPTNPVIFTSGQINPVEGARSSPGDWDGIYVSDSGSLSMEYASIQYADAGISFVNGGSGNISNSLFEYASTGITIGNSSDIRVRNSLFRFNSIAINIANDSSPIIGPGNTIRQNNNGIFLRQYSTVPPTPSITGNYILDNGNYNINVTSFSGGNSVTVDVRGNYWGSDDPVTIAARMNQSSTSYPAIDFSDFILTADVPPGIDSVFNGLQSCPVVRITDDGNFIDNYPDNDIAWTGSNYSDVLEIEKAFNHARSIDSSIFQYLIMPTQAEWDAMSVQVQGLYLINSERQARGIKPYEGISQNVVAVTQSYADYIRQNNQVIGHYVDGKSPDERLDEDLVIRDNKEPISKTESVYGSSGIVSLPLASDSVVDAIYRWIYVDKSGGNNWGHRDHIIQTGLNENSGETHKEGLIGFGVSIGNYDPALSLPESFGAVVVLNTIDSSSTWDHSTTQTVDTDAAQLCNNNVVISIDEWSVDVAQITELEISPSDIFLTPGATAQLQVMATFLNGSRVDITSSASFIADNLSVVDISAGTITALRSGVLSATATANGVTSNRVRILVGDAVDIANLTGTFAEDYLDYVPDNATIDHYDPKIFSLYTGVVNDKTGAPLADVIISINNRPEYGNTKTDIYGRFNIAAEAGVRTIVYKKSGYLTLHREVASASHSWAVADDVIMLAVDPKQTPINLSISIPQIHTSTVVTDAFGSRSTTLIFNDINSATVSSADGSQRSLTEFSVRATEYELPNSMPANLPKETAFTYCADLQIPGVRDDETVIFDNPVVMYVDNFLGFNVGEIVPIGYYDRQVADWIASDNGVVVKLLDSDGDGLVDGLDFDGDDIADDYNLNGSTTDEVVGVVGVEKFAVNSTYWRGSFNHFTPWDFNWPFGPPDDAKDPGEIKPETGKEDKKQDEKACTGSYVKPETQAFHEDIPITGTNLILHYSSQRTDGYKHKFNVKVTGSSIPDSLLGMIAKLDIGGHVFTKEFTIPAANIEAEFIWDGKDIANKRVKGVVSGLISIGFKYPIKYSSAKFVSFPMTPELLKPAWAEAGTNITNIPGRGEFISWNSSPVAVQNTFDNQIADGWSISNHHLPSSIGNIYKGDGEVIDTDKSSVVLRTGIKIRRYAGDDGFYQKGGKDIDYAINTNVVVYNPNAILNAPTEEKSTTLSDKVTGLEWQYIDAPETFRTIDEANAYCLDAGFTSDKDGWRLPTIKEIVYTIDKSEGIQEYLIYKTDVYGMWSNSNNNPDEKLLPVICVRGETIDSRYITDLKRDDTLEVVVDGQTGLMWQDDISTTSITRNWTGAIDYCEAEMDGFAGYSDWRLPNINELVYALPNTVFINQTVFTGEFWGPTHSLRKPYWSSTPYPSNATQSWAIESFGAASPFFENADSYNVRCVRDNTQAVKSPYRFDEYGKHIETVDLDSGITENSFNYNENGQLISITDKFGDTTTITRTGLSGKASYITSEDGYVTSLTIVTSGTLEDQSNHLTQVTYDDNTNYRFGYLGTTALMTSKIDPNNNTFLHQFHPDDGRTIQTSDDEGGVWNFFSTRQGNRSALYGYNTAELNTYQTLRTILDNGDVNKVTTLFDGTQLSNLNQADDLKQTLQSCAVTTVIDKVIDTKTKEPIPSKITITQPNTLQSVTQITKTYGKNGADTTQQTLAISLNGRPNSTVVTDSKTGTTVSTSAVNRITTINVDPATLLLQSTQTPGLFDTSYTYDTRGRQKTITTGARTTTFTYEPVSKGDVTYITADDGKITNFEYDALGRVKKIIYPGGTHQTENFYDENGNLETVVTPRPATHGMTYNAVNKVKTETKPKEGLITEVTSYLYDKERNLQQITLPSTKIITNTYTSGLLDYSTTPEGVIDYAYTCNEKVASISEGTESITYGYDGSLLEDITYAGALNKVISQTYYNNFNLKTLNYSGQITNFAYDNDLLLTSANGYTITRNSLNGLPEILGNGTLLQNRMFNGYGEAETVTTKVNAKDIYNYTLTYNDLGKIESKTETLDDGSINTYVYLYDDRRRLDTVTKNGVLVEDYGYDGNGNRNLQTNTARSISAQSATYNLGDQLKTVGTIPYNYDADGYLSNKTTAAGITTYSYSSQGRLLQVVAPSKTITYQHNALGNRVAKLVNGVVTEKYLWLDKTTLLATYDATDTLLQRYQYTDGNTPDSFTQGGQTYYIVTDHLGSPRAITDSLGAIIKKLDYDSFGNVISDSNPGLVIPFGFAGGLFDVDTGLVRFGFRDYDPDVGRWTARDPIGFGGGDTNLYGYTSNDPVNFIDPSGKFGVTTVIGFVSGAVAGYAGAAASNQNAIGRVIGGFSGAIAGAIVGTINPGAAVAAGTLASRVITGAAVGFLSNIGGQAAAIGINPQANSTDFSPGSVIANGVLGAITGPLSPLPGAIIYGVGNIGFDGLKGTIYNNYLKPQPPQNICP